MSHIFESQHDEAEALFVARHIMLMACEALEQLGANPPEGTEPHLRYQAHYNSVNDALISINEALDELIPQINPPYKRDFDEEEGHNTISNLWRPPIDLTLTD